MALLKVQVLTFDTSLSDKVPLENLVNVVDQATHLILNSFGLDVGFNETSTFKPICVTSLTIVFMML